MALRESLSFLGADHLFTDMMTQAEGRACWAACRAKLLRLAVILIVAQAAAGALTGATDACEQWGSVYALEARVVDKRHQGKTMSSGSYALRTLAHMSR